MNKKLRVIGLSCIAALASCCTLQVSAAQASGLFVTEGNQSARIAMAGSAKFTVGSFAVSCKTFHSESEKSETLFPTAEIMTLGPIFKECTGPGGAEATVAASGCDERTHDTLDTGGGIVDAHIDTICTEGSTGTIASAGCEISFGSQEALERATLSNVASSPPSVRDEVNLKMKVTVVKSVIPCTLSKGEAEAVDSDTTTVTATHLGKPIGLFVE